MGKKYLQNYLDANLLYPDEEMLLRQDCGLIEKGPDECVAYIAHYLREVGKQHPVLEMVADWLDPEVTNKGWKIVFKRHRGKRKASQWTATRQKNLADAVHWEMQKPVHARWGWKQRAVEIVARKNGVSSATVRRALAARQKKKVITKPPISRA